MRTSKKSAGTVRLPGQNPKTTAPAELPRVANAIQAPRGGWRTTGRRCRRHKEWKGGPSFGGLRNFRVRRLSREAYLQKLKRANRASRAGFNIPS